MSTATIRPTETRPPLIAALGGIRGLLDGGAPPLLFVAVNAIAGAQTTRLSRWRSRALPPSAPGSPS